MARLSVPVTGINLGAGRSKLLKVGTIQDSLGSEVINRRSCGDKRVGDYEPTRRDRGKNNLGPSWIRCNKPRSCGDKGIGDYE